MAWALLQATPPAAPFRVRPCWHCGCKVHDANRDPVFGVAARDDHCVGLCHCSDVVYTRADDRQRGHHYDADTGREASPTAESARAWQQAESLGPLPGYRSCLTPLYWQEVRAILLSTSEWQHRPWRPTRPVLVGALRLLVSVVERNACRQRYSDCT